MLLVLGAGGPELSGTVTLSDANDLEEDTNAEGGRETRWAARLGTLHRVWQWEVEAGGTASVRQRWDWPGVLREPTQWTCGYNRAGWWGIWSKGWVGQ